MPKLIDLRGYTEIILKGDTEPAIIAFRSRVAEMCKAEVTTEDAVQGDKEPNGLIENSVMQIRGHDGKTPFEGLNRHTETF